MKPVICNRKDEIGVLSSRYNLLINRVGNLLIELQESEQRKKNFQLKMLQNQIGPHFLHNTLICIGSLIRQNKSNEAEIAIRSLGNLLSYSFENTNEMVGLDEEIKRLSDYVEIQKMRYGDVFRYAVKNDVEEGEFMIPKLIFQPIIENAIFHGLMPSEKDEKIIYIRVRRYKSGIFISIYDNGVGMDENVQAQAVKGLKRSEKQERFSGLGVYNVVERLQLYYGSECALKIRSVINKFTLIQIKIP